MRRLDVRGILRHSSPLSLRPEHIHLYPPNFSLPLAFGTFSIPFFSCPSHPSYPAFAHVPVLVFRPQHRVASDIYAIEDAKREAAGLPPVSKAPRTDGPRHETATDEQVYDRFKKR